MSVVISADYEWIIIILLFINYFWIASIILLVTLSVQLKKFGMYHN